MLCFTVVQLTSTIEWIYNLVSFIRSMSHQITWKAPQNDMWEWSDKNWLTKHAQYIEYGTIVVN